METSRKISETELEITNTIPEQVIPAKVEVEVVKIDELKSKISLLEDKVVQHTEWLKTPQAELDKITNDIANIQAEIDSLSAKVTAAIESGVKAESEIVTEAEEKVVTEEKAPVA